jgi:hypothetical protein
VRGTTRTGLSHLLLGFLNRGVVKLRLEIRSQLTDN